MRFKKKKRRQKWVFVYSKKALPKFFYLFKREKDKTRTKTKLGKLGYKYEGMQTEAKVKERKTRGTQRKRAKEISQGRKKNTRINLEKQEQHLE